MPDTVGGRRHRCGRARADLTAALFDECRAIAAENGYPPRPDSLKASLRRLTNPGSLVTASLLDDVDAARPDRGGPHPGGIYWERPWRVIKGGPLATTCGLHSSQGGGGTGGARVGHRQSQRIKTAMSKQSHRGYLALLGNGF